MICLKIEKLAILFACVLFTINLWASENSTHKYFEKIRNEPTLLRNFLYKVPKGGDLHNHLDGAIYAESYIAWAAKDGKCVDLEDWMITMPPCNAENDRPPVQDIQYNADTVNQFIDALSVRNFERRPVSGHDQFFSTFRRFLPASFGNEGYMLAEVSARAALQNIVYLELMQSWGMDEARHLAANNPAFSPGISLPTLIENPAIDRLVDASINRLDMIEKQWRDHLSCGTDAANSGCDVPIRYLAQVIRVFSREQVLAQTLLAFKLIQRDERYVGLNFVAPEDNPVTLRDYRWQMQIIGGLAEFFPSAKRGITLHAGEVVMGLVPPEHLGWHIRSAITMAGARRIGHGIDIIHDPESVQLMEHMARQGILVEINLTSNDVILGIKNEYHPFRAYRKYKVPMAFSTDDEGVSRIDLTHEYQRAVETYGLNYQDIKHYSRNALTYSFLAGNGLLDQGRGGGFVKECNASIPGKKPASAVCMEFLEKNEKARWQWELETRFNVFEENY